MIRDLHPVVQATLQICLTAVITLVLHVLYSLFKLLFLRPLTDPLRHLPGPQGSMLQSHLQQVMNPALSALTHQDWRTRFGQTFRFNGFGKHDYRLMSFDFRVISHVLTSTNYQKPWQTRSFLGRLIGRGIFSMEGDEHKFQRRILAPAFTLQAIKNITPVFFRKADELHDRWKSLIDGRVSSDGEASSTVSLAINSASASGVVIDVAHWISRASFDVIGLAGFDYDFHSLQDETEEVYGAYRRMFNIADKGLALREILELYFPILRKIWVNDDIRTTNQSLKTIARVGKEIIGKKKVAYQNDNEGTDKDILSLLIKSNLSNDPSKRLTDQELLDQCSTFLLAGSDTVSVAISWCFHFLSLHPDIQDRLRKEICSVQRDGSLSDSSTDSGFHDCTTGHPRSQADTVWAGLCRCPPRTHWDLIEKLPYLDAVVRETLRFCPPVHATIRVAMEDDQIPISFPVTLANGDTVGKDGIQGHIKIGRGTYIHIPIEGFSFSEDVWGKDALSFNPDRWAKIKEWDPTKPGVNNLMTFGYGPHSCLGHRFTLAEIKIFIASLLPHFDFSPAEDIKILKFNSILTRPFVAGKWSSGTQLPLCVREVN